MPAATLISGHVFEDGPAPTGLALLHELGFSEAGEETVAVRSDGDLLAPNFSARTLVSMSLLPPQPQADSSSDHLTREIT